MLLDKRRTVPPSLKDRFMHRPPARRLPLPYLQIINPLEGLVGAEDQTRNKPADMFKPFRTTKDLSKAFHPLGQDLRHPNNRQHGFTFFFYLTPLIFLHLPIFPNNLPSRALKQKRESARSIPPVTSHGV